MLRKKPLAATSAGLVLAVAAATAPTTVMAQAVYCTNCASQLTQLKQQADQAATLLNQIEQLQVQMRSYEQMMTDGRVLSSQMFGNVARDITQLNSLLERGQALAYTAGDLDQQFQARYGTYEGYAASGVNDEQLQAKYRQWSSESNDSVLNALRGLNLQAQGMDSEAAMLRQLQSRASSAQGQMQAVQVGNELAAESVAQMHRLRQLLMVQTQLQAQQYQVEADRNAVGAARAREFFQGSGPEYSGQTY